MNEADPSGTLAAAAARLRRSLSLLIIFLGLVLAAERAGYAGLFEARDSALASLSGAIMVQAMLAIPALFYLGALWALRQTAAAVATGASFGEAVEHSLRKVGYCLITGAMLALFAMPFLQRLLDPGPPRSIDHDVATMIIAGVGLGLVFLARIVRQAGAVQAELDQIF